MATNNAPAFFVKHPAAVPYAKSSVYDALVHLPDGYYHDARLHALRHGYISAGPQHAAPLNYIFAPAIPSDIIPVHFAAPIHPFASYIPPHLPSHLKAYHFIGRHFPKA